MAHASTKIPQVTLLFWIMKICATTLGETGGDLLSMTLNVGYAASSLILIGIFLVTLVAQVGTRQLHPVLYWLVILSTSTAGTTMSDFMDRTLGLGYATGSTLLALFLIGVLAFWQWREGSISISRVRSTRIELYYWSAILVSNTLGTALGDYLADASGLGFGGSALLISSLILLLALAHRFTSISKVALFWLAFVLTRPLGATAGDLMTKPVQEGGMDLGTWGSSAVLLTILVAAIAYVHRRHQMRIAETT